MPYVVVVAAVVPLSREKKRKIKERERKDKAQEGLAVEATWRWASGCCTTAPPAQHDYLH